MERPQPEIRPRDDEHDFEFTRRQANALALADELLKLRDPESRLTFVDILLDSDDEDIRQELLDGPLAGMLKGATDELAMESDGSYYPVVHMTKARSMFTGMRLTMWGWDQEKIRYTGGEHKDGGYEYRTYEGQKDRSVKFEFSMGYRSLDDPSVMAAESLSLSVSSSVPGGKFAVSRDVWMSPYAETGYEGHDQKYNGKPTKKQVEWFLDLVAKSVGDEPISEKQFVHNQVMDFAMKADGVGAGEGVRALIDGTWDAQALYLMKLPLKMLDGCSVVARVNTANQYPEHGVAAGDAARELLAAWCDRDNSGRLSGMIQRQ